MLLKFWKPAQDAPVADTPDWTSSNPAWPLEVGFVTALAVIAARVTGPIRAPDRATRRVGPAATGAQVPFGCFARTGNTYVVVTSLPSGLATVVDVGVVSDAMAIACLSCLAAARPDSMALCAASAAPRRGAGWRGVATGCAADRDFAGAIVPEADAVAAVA